MPSLDATFRPKDSFEAKPDASSSGSDEVAWARLAQRGDTQAFEHLVTRYRARLLQLVRLMVTSSSDAEEIIQETLVSAFRALPQAKFTSESPRPVQAWLYRIAVNAALMHLRRQRRRPTLSLEELPSLGEGEGGAWPGVGRLWERGPDEVLLGRELGQKLLEALSRLPDKYRLVLWLRDVEEATNEEVAELLGLTVPTVKARLHRARLAVRSTLDVTVRHAI